MTDRHTRPIPTTEELFELPIDTLPERIVEIAERVTQSPVGLYVIDLEGVALLQLVGDVSLPEEVPIPQMSGPEIPSGHLAALERSMAARGIGQIVPLWLRHRAIAVFLVDGPGGAELQEFAGRAAAALELSLRYADRVDSARHRQRATAGAELQQQLLPPRIAGVRGAEIAGSVLPAYDVGGDWFDHGADGGGAWLAVADASGKGARASAVSALSLAAFRAGRQAGASVTEAAILMDQAVVGFGDASLFVTTLLARWDAATRTLEWLTCGHLRPCRLSPQGRVDELTASVFPPLGVLDGVRLATTRSVLVPGDRVVLYSDGVIERRSLTGRIGRSGFFEHVAAIDQPSAASLLTHIITHVSAAHETPLDDDATVLVLGILDDRKHEPKPHPPSLEPAEGA